MGFWDKAAEKWKSFEDSVAPVMSKVKTGAKAVSKGARITWRHLFAMRRIFISIPVAVVAVILAVQNQATLPAIVGLDLQTNGTFSIQILREIAVLGPLAITALCLLLVFCSKRTLTPWLVSVFTLVIPFVIKILNTFPG